MGRTGKDCEISREIGNIVQIDAKQHVEIVDAHNLVGVLLFDTVNVPRARARNRLGIVERARVGRGGARVSVPVGVDERDLRRLRHLQHACRGRKSGDPVEKRIKVQDSGKTRAVRM